MKTRIRNLSLLPALIAGLAFILAGGATAQTFTTLHSFAGNDGGAPEAGLAISGSTLYGTAWRGGSSDNGTIFRLNTDGTAFTNLHSFSATAAPSYTNSDGATPEDALVVSGSTLYGTAEYGGASGYGIVFRLNTDGSGFTNLHSFTGGGDGANPYAGLILSGNTLYGTTQYGDTPDNGTVFRINTDGSGFTNLHSFTPITDFTNSDGAQPQTGLILSGNTLYGTAYVGGASGNGTVFRLNTDGTGFTNLYSFNGDGDGADPYGGVVLSGNTLFGTTGFAGTWGNGTVFRVNIDSSAFTNLHSFTGGSDGTTPYAGLAISGNALYGTAPYGGAWGDGNVFKVNTDGTSFTNLHSFTATPGPFDTNSDGSVPQAGVLLSGNTLYGTASGGGSAGDGTAFSLSLESVGAPQLAIISSASNVVLTWPTNAAGFTLQSATNLTSPADWTTVSPGPVVVNAQNTVTNPASRTRQFYRLSQ
jgi:uncharacterized repeat protein (TIGR03803 family)